jgi:hypothetical protein
MKSDFAEAKGEILIVSPFVRNKRVDAILEWLKEPLQAGVQVTVVTRPAESYREPERTVECLELLRKFATVIEKPTSTKNLCSSITALFGTKASTC